MTHLVSLAGNSTKSIYDINPNELNNYSAGVLFMKILAAEQNGKMSGWLTDLGRKVKNITKDTINFVADKGGDALRLVTDPDVIGGVSRAGAAIATGGASEAGMSLTEKLKSYLPGGAAPADISGADFNLALANIGESFKQAYSKNNYTPYIVGGSVLVGTFVLFKLLSKKRR